MISEVTWEAHLKQKHSWSAVAVQPLNGKFQGGGGGTWRENWRIILVGMIVLSLYLIESTCLEGQSLTVAGNVTIRCDLREKPDPKAVCQNQHERSPTVVGKIRGAQFAHVPARHCWYTDTNSRRNNRTSAATWTANKNLTAVTGPR